MKNRIGCLTLFWLIIANTAFAQTAVKDTIMTPDQMGADFEIYKKALNESQAGLYWYINPIQLNAEFKSVERAISKPRYKNQFYKSLLRVTASLKHGHSFLVNDQLYGINYMLRDLIPNQHYLPFALSIVENKLFVTVNCSDYRRLNPGSQILSIDGKSINVLLREFYDFIPADGGNISYKNYKLEKFGFHYLYSLLYPKKENYKVVFKAPGVAERQSAMISGVIPDSLEVRFKQLTGKSTNNFSRSLEYRKLEKYPSISYLKVSSFYEGLTNRNGVEFTRFLGSSFNQISISKTKKTDP